MRKEKDVDGREELRPRPTVLDPTRASPEPWFVGSGKGLMIVVLSLCAVLIVVRGASTIWMAEEAWGWWTQRVRSQATIADVPRETVPRAPPASYEQAEWITPDDYPPAAIRAQEQGAVRIRWVVDANGRATRCDVIDTSGYVLLDRAACRAILRSARYRPSADAVERTFTRRVVWRLPEN